VGFMLIRPLTALADTSVSLDDETSA